MFVRLTTLTGTANVAAVVEFLETTARPAVEGMAGHRGLAVLKDETAGTVAVAAYWDTAEQLDASEGAVTKLRGSVADIAGGGAFTVEVYEAAVTKRWSMPAAGAIARLLRVESDVADIEAAIAFWTEEALPAIEGSAGLVSAQLLIDRATGKGISVTGWETQDALDAAASKLDGLRERISDSVPSASFIGIEQLTIASSSAQLAT